MKLTDRVHVVLANNPGMMTLDGTNTYVLREPGSRESVVIDPGPLDEAHLQAVLAIAQEDGARVSLVLYSHWHPDHTEAIDRFVELTGAPARALDAKWCRGGADVLTDGEVLDVDGLQIEVVATPGHTSDSICLFLPAERVLLTADTVLGRGTTVVAHPDGSLGDYLESLKKIRDLVQSGKVGRFFPAHGDTLEDPGAVIDAYLLHREQRLQQVRDAVAEGAQTAREVVERVYADVDPQLWWAAEMSVRAQLDYLGV